MPSDFFTSLGRSVCAELAQPSGRYGADPAKRARLAATVSSELAAHLNRLPTMAADQSLTSSMPPRGGRNYDQSTLRRGGTSTAIYDQEDPDNGTRLDADACMLLVVKCVQGLDDDERDKFVEGLASLLQSDAMDGTLSRRSQMPRYGDGNGSNGLRDNNRGALDRRRGSARDNRRHVGAMDSAGTVQAQTSAFLRRFPEARHIKFTGTGV